MPWKIKSPFTWQIFIFESSASFHLAVVKGHDYSQSLVPVRSLRLTYSNHSGSRVHSLILPLHFLQIAGASLEMKLGTQPAWQVVPTRVPIEESLLCVLPRQTHCVLALNLSSLCGWPGLNLQIVGSPGPTLAFM